jgi:hypothetical protein
MRARDGFIKKVKTRYWKQTHKYCLAIPKSVSEALAFDKWSGTDFCRNAIEKEMINMMPAIEFRDDDKISVGYTMITCHMIIDLKQAFSCISRLAAGGHQTELPNESVYSSVVMRDRVRIAFTMAAVNFLEVLPGDFQNAYLNAPTDERSYCTAGPEFGPSQMGRPVLIVQVLYGLQSSVARWRDHTAATLRDAGRKNCLKPDLYMRPALKPCGFKYWQYVLYMSMTYLLFLTSHKK